MRHLSRATLGKSGISAGEILSEEMSNYTIIELNTNYYYLFIYLFDNFCNIVHK